VRCAGRFRFELCDHIGQRSGPASLMRGLDFFASSLEPRNGQIEAISFLFDPRQEGPLAHCCTSSLLRSQVPWKPS
jgi:hypothetical protein